MFSAFISAASCYNCSSILDLGPRGQYTDLHVGAGGVYCLRFTSRQGIFVMNYLGAASAVSYFSYNFGGNLYRDSQLFGRGCTAPSPRAISYGTVFGYIVISTPVAEDLFYSYLYANESCGSLSIFSKDSSGFFFPNFTQSVSAGQVYCFFFAVYGSKSLSIARYSDPSISSESLFYSYGDSFGGLPFGRSSFSNMYPMQFIYNSYSGSAASRFYINFETNKLPHDEEVEGTFKETSIVSHINAISCMEQSNSYTAFSLSISADSSSGTIGPGTVVAICLWIIFIAFFIPFVAVFTLKTLAKRKKVNIPNSPIMDRCNLPSDPLLDSNRADLFAEFNTYTVITVDSHSYGDFPSQPCSISASEMYVDVE